MVIRHFPSASSRPFNVQENEADTARPDAMFPSPKQGPPKDVASVSLQPVQATLDQSEDSQASLATEQEDKAGGRHLANMPQLQGAQNLLRQQLQSMKDAVEAELRERQKEVKVSLLTSLCLFTPLSVCCHV